MYREDKGWISVLINSITTGPVVISSLRPLAGMKIETAGSGHLQRLYAVHTPITSAAGTVGGSRVDAQLYKDRTGWGRGR